MEDVSTYNFSTALSWMKQGRFVVRQSWPEFASLCLREDHSFQYTEDGQLPVTWETIKAEDILADDWMDAIKKEEPVEEALVEETPAEAVNEETI